MKRSPTGGLPLFYVLLFSVTLDEAVDIFVVDFTFLVLAFAAHGGEFHAGKLAGSNQSNH